MDQRIETCISYFKERPVFDRVFRGFREKYAGLGHMGGNVVLSNVTLKEKQELGGFFGKDFTKNKTISISAKAVEKVLATSRFSGISLEQILEAYFEESLVTKREKAREEEQRREEYLSSLFLVLQKQKEDHPAKEWFFALTEKRTEGWQLFITNYNEDGEALIETLTQVFAAILKLPYIQKDFDTKIHLAVFAAKATGNPHFFDRDTLAEKFLTYFLQYDLGKIEDTSVWESEQKNLLYYKAGIVFDDLSNDVLLYGILAKKKDGGTHEGLAGFQREQEPLRLTLSSIAKLSEAWGEGPIYVMENPAYFSEFIHANPEKAAICGNGQIRLANLMLMDLLAKNNIFFYAGDFDPEGLLIAQRLKKRYGEKLQLWNYDKERYIKYRSDVTIPEKSLKQLEHITLPELMEVVSCMRMQKKASYQESQIGENVACN